MLWAFVVRFFICLCCEHATPDVKLMTMFSWFLVLFLFACDFWSCSTLSYLSHRNMVFLHTLMLYGLSMPEQDGNCIVILQLQSLFVHCHDRMVSISKSHSIDTISLYTYCHWSSWSLYVCWALPGSGSSCKLSEVNFLALLCSAYIILSKLQFI